MQRVAAYCRVSTDNEDQSNSLISQKKYFADYIERNPMWDLTEVYVDEGITGTSTKKRHSFNRMIQDAQNRKFDMVITKEISRFARNTLDSIYYTRKLKELGIGVFFMNDNINTLDPDSELRLTIMSSIAQEESRKTSERVKWGQKRRMEQGVVFGRDMLGYDVKDGKLAVNEDGAEIVRLIYHKFVNEGKGTHVISRELREAGIKTSTYMKQWTNTVILRVLRNEKYCGDLIQKKTYTPSYLNHEKKYNRGEEEFVSISNHHEPIISRELFDKAQMELKRRSPDNEQKTKYSNRYCFSGKIKCEVCGGTYGDKAAAMKRFIQQYSRLDANICHRLVIENDDRQYTIADVLSIGESEGIPVVFDNLHHQVNPENTRSEIEWISACRNTWKTQDGRQKLHYAQQNMDKRLGSHSSTLDVDEFLQFYKGLDKHDIDIMVEVKDKNLSAIKCINAISPPKIQRLENEWARYKYLVLERSLKIYNEIRQLLKEKSDYPISEFYRLIDDAMKTPITVGNAVNAAQHVWGYVNDLADEKERMSFKRSIDKISQGGSTVAIKRKLWNLANIQKQKYLLDSLYFIEVL